MKNFLYLLTVTVLFISCEKDSTDEIINDDNSTSIFVEGVNGKSSCSISGPLIVTPGTTIRYYSALPTPFDTTSDWFLQDIPADWSAVDVVLPPEDGIQAIDITFGSSFTCGRLRFSYSDGSCTSIMEIRADNICDCNYIPTTDVYIKQSGFCSGEIINFEAFPNGSKDNGIYNWSVSSGTITSGQGTKNISVATLPGVGFSISVDFTSECGESASGINLAEFSASCGGGGGFGF